MPIILEGITAETTFAPGTDYIASLKLIVPTVDTSSFAKQTDLDTTNTNLSTLNTTVSGINTAVG
jgi:hypothetical protein